MDYFQMLEEKTQELYAIAREARKQDLKSHLQRTWPNVWKGLLVLKAWLKESRNWKSL